MDEEPSCIVVPVYDESGHVVDNKIVCDEDAVQEHLDHTSQHNRYAPSRNSGLGALIRDTCEVVTVTDESTGATFETIVCPD